HEQRRARALHGRLKRLQRHVGLGPLLALRGARVGRLHLAVPACVEERLPNHRDRSHERARIALGRRLEGDHLHRVLLEHRGARAASGGGATNASIRPGYTVRLSPFQMRASAGIATCGPTATMTPSRITTVPRSMTWPGAGTIRAPTMACTRGVAARDRPGSTAKTSNAPAMAITRSAVRGA